MPAAPEPAQDLLVVPASGEAVDLNDERAVALALRSIRELEDALKQAKAVLNDALVARAKVFGSRTLHLDGIGKVEVKGGTETTYAAEEIERELREAGMPEERIREVVKETVTYTVNAVEAKRCAAVNPVYAEIIERHTTKREKRAYASVA